MVEQYLQFAIQFTKKIWLQLNTMFELEDTQVFKFLKPYFLQLQDNPTYMGIAIALLALLSYSLYKIISIPRKRINKLNDREKIVNELEKKLNDRRKHLNELEKKRNDREKNVNELEKKLNDRRKHLNELEKKLNDRENHLNELEKELNEREKKFNGLKDEMNGEEEGIDSGVPRVIEKDDYNNWYRKMEEKKESVGSDQQTQPIFDEEKALYDFVEKTNHSDFLFRDIFNDLDDAVEARDDQLNSIVWPDWPPLILMAYGYAIRTAAAALYIQGLLRKDQYLLVKDVFIELQIRTGGTVAFQEQAALESMKFMTGYNKALTRSMIQGINMIPEGCEIPPGEYVSDDELLRRVKVVTKNVTSDPRYANDQEDYDIDVITKAVLEKIPNEEIAYQFVLEEIEGASGGNEEARKFAKDSVFLKDEYKGAIKDSSPEVDGFSGPQQTLTRLTLGRLKGSSMDEMARVRIEVVKNVIKHWKLDDQSGL